MGRKRCLAAILVSLCLVFIPINVTGADKTERLIELLIKKGIINSEEAKVLQEELGEGEGSEAQEPKSADWTKKIELGYKKGTYIKTTDDRFSLKLNGRIQPYFLHRDNDAGDDNETFLFRRARILAKGNVLYPWFKYGLQITLEGPGSALRDATIEATYLNYLKPTVGQFKVPFDREFLTSGYSLQLIERSIANAAFSLGRDIGIQASGSQIADVFEYRVGVFNGNGINRINVDEDYIYTGRLVWSPFGPYPYSQAALDNPESPLLAVGVGGAYMPGLDPGERAILAGRLGRTTIMPVESDVSQWTADLAFKYKRLSLEAGYHYREIDPNTWTTFGSQDANGYYIQGGYFLIPKEFEIAARYSFVEPDNPNQINNNDLDDFTIGGTYYFLGHPIKTQVNYSFLTTETATGDQNDHLFLATMCLEF